MKLSELGQGKPKVRKYNYQGVNLLFVEPDREKFLEFTEVALSPLTDLTKAHERYKSEVKKQEADEKIAIEQGLLKAPDSSTKVTLRRMLKMDAASRFSGFRGTAGGRADKIACTSSCPSFPQAFSTIASSASFTTMFERFV